MSIIKDNAGLIAYQARKFPHTNITDTNDYMQTGVESMLICQKRHNPAKSKFSSYLWTSVYRAIKQNQFDKFKRRLHNLTLKTCSFVKDDQLWEILPDTLTNIEIECVRLLYEKNKIKMIAKELEIKLKDVKALLESVVEKVRVANGTD